MVNQLLEDMLHSSDKLIEKYYKDLLEQMRRENFQAFESSLYAKVLYQLNKQGIPIRYATTERDDYANSPQLIKEAMLLDPEFAKIIKAKGGLQNIDYQFISSGFAKVCSAVRDMAIFVNISDLGKENNLLFIGFGHDLWPFKRQQHDFDVYELIMPTPSDDVTGKLPSKLESMMSKLQEKYRNHRFEIEYVD
jgi:hypothetical protein